MNKQQYEGFYLEKLVTIDELTDKSNRTLLWGYTFERESYHTYINNGEIITVIYNYDENPRRVEIQENQNYIPNKRLYPECCDYEFSTLLSSRGCYLSFTTYDEERCKNKYYGRIL